MQEKLLLLAKIRRLSDVVHSGDLDSYELLEEHRQAMRDTLDKLTEKYIEKYC